ncbi:MAG: ABC transporter ATP-binding protein [Thermofilum sp. ex4484_15]|nr:MAG: ABC transporter ATP-binding protein [Thermofilum sp. ex4484_15]
MKSELDALGVVKKFGGLVALKGVNISVVPSTITMLIGPNGSGKTTLINVISGIYKPDEGKVLLRGKDITGLPPHEVYSLGLVRTFQIPSPFLRLTVLENLMVVAKNQLGEKPISAVFRRRRWMREEEELEEKAFRVMELLHLERLWNRRASELSGGQMKLLEIGRALMSDPSIILMDEPVAGVNPKLAYDIMEYITNVRKELGISFLIVEHRLDIVLDYVDYVYAMHKGEIIARGPPEEVISNPSVVRSYLGG